MRPMRCAHAEKYSGNKKVFCTYVTRSVWLGELRFSASLNERQLHIVATLLILSLTRSVRSRRLFHKVRALLSARARALVCTRADALNLISEKLAYSRVRELAHSRVHELYETAS